jgi:hypothetical protein
LAWQLVVIDAPPVTDRVAGGHGLLAADAQNGKPAPASVAVEIKKSRRLMFGGSSYFIRVVLVVATRNIFARNQYVGNPRCLDRLRIVLA